MSEGVHRFDQSVSSWEVIRLGWAAKMLVPMRDKPTDLSGDVPWIRIEDVSSKYVGESLSSQGVSRETIRQMNLKVFPPGTVLCTCSCSMGATAIAARPIVTNQTFIGIVPSGRLDSDFLYYLMQANADRLQAQATGAIQQYLSRNDFENLRIAVPPVAIQRAIASFLDRQTAAIDALIAKKERLIELLQEKRQAVIAQAVTRGLDAKVDLKSSGASWVDAVPSHWRVIPLRYLVTSIQTGTTPPTDNALYHEDGDVPWYGPAAFSDALEVGSPTRFLTKLALHDGRVKVVPADSVGIVTIGATVGRVGLIRQAATTNQQITSLTFARKYLMPEFAALQLKILENVLRSMAAASTLPILNQSAIGQLPLLVPPREEQQLIVTRIFKTLTHGASVTARLNDSASRLREYRQALISAAVTGKIEIPAEEAA